MPFEVFDQPLGIINPNIKAVVRGPQKCPGQFAQLAGGGSGQFGEWRTTSPVNQAFLEIDADRGIGSFEEPLNFAKECFVHSKVGMNLLSPILTNSSVRQFNARRHS